MNIQIFGTKKCNDTKKAERFFKERGIKYQFIDMKEKGMIRCFWHRSQWMQQRQINRL